MPQKDAPLKLNEAGNWIPEEVSCEVNEPDAYALEEALRQKEKHGGRVPEHLMPMVYQSSASRIIRKRSPHHRLLEKPKVTGA